MGSLFSKNYLNSDIPESRGSGTGIYTMVVKKSFLERSGYWKELDGRRFTIAGFTMAIRLKCFEDQRIYAELQSRCLDSQKVCIIVAIRNNNPANNVVTALSTEIYPDGQKQIEMPLHPLQINDPSLLFLARECFTLSFMLRMRGNDNELWEMRLNEDVAIVRWDFKNLFEFDSCVFDSRHFEIGGSSWWLEFCPRGPSGNEDLACVYLHHDVDNEVSVILQCEAVNVNKDKSVKKEAGLQVSFWRPALLDNAFSSEFFTDAEHGFLFEGWFTILIGIRFPEDLSSSDENSKHKRKTDSPVSDDEGKKKTEDIDLCMICSTNRRSACLVHGDGTSHKVVCGDCARALELKRSARCPFCWDKFEEVVCH